MVLTSLLRALYVPNFWQNRLPEDLGLLIILLAVVAVLVHFIIRHVRPPIREVHH